jgi:hypothetical protein
MLQGFKHRGVTQPYPCGEIILDTQNETVADLPTPEQNEKKNTCRRLPNTASKYEVELTHKFKMQRKANRKLTAGFTPVPKTGWRAVEAAKLAAEKAAKKEELEKVKLTNEEVNELFQ